MSFYSVLENWKNFDFYKYFYNLTEEDILDSIYKEKKNDLDFLNLLSPKAKKFLEIMAQESARVTRQYFGNEISLFLPIYVSNYCTSNCIYCGFSKKNSIKRKHMSLNEIKNEAYEIAKTKIENILLLTGEAKEIVTMDYLEKALKILRLNFSSISFEIMPLEVEEYIYLQQLGLDGVTVFQETYDEDRYSEVHLSGEKKNFRYRLDTPERCAIANLRTVTIGSLLGLSDATIDIFKTGLHLDYLIKKYPNTFFSICFPRINKAEGNLVDCDEVDDITFVQYILAVRLFQNNVGITISTRETANMRDNLLKLGVTKISAGSSTEVGGYTKKDASTAQFDIEDTRSVKEIIKSIKDKKLEPIFKDWEVII